MIKKSNKVVLYNIGFSPVMLYLIPEFWLISIPFNFIFDSFILLLGLKFFVKKDILISYRKTILKVWLFGYLADFVGAFVQLGFEFLSGIAFKESVMLNPFGGIFPFIATLISVGIAGFMIYVFNRKLCLKKTQLEDEQKKKVALFMAICTTPYLFFMPLVF